MIIPNAAEGWAYVYGHPNHMVNIYGDIIGCRRGYILKPFADRYGYLRLSLGNTDNVYVHQIVGRTFLTCPSQVHQVNHIDGNKQNNYYLNLEWVNASQNIKHAIKLGLQDPLYGLTFANEANRLKRLRKHESR